MSNVKCLACAIRIELAPPSPCSYSRLENRNEFRAQSMMNSAANGAAQIHQGRRRAVGPGLVCSGLICSGLVCSGLVCSGADEAGPAGARGLGPGPGTAGRWAGAGGLLTVVRAL